MSVQVATTAILSMSNDELNEVIQAVKYRRNQLARQNTRKLRVGDVVEFTGKGGRTVRGKVTKVNPKTCIVRDEAQRVNWRVSASLLTPVTETA